ncbi:MAG: transcription elongation factor GreA [Parcubacteria group bacterium Gr01-1014_18]|nr:MAG: transcription elongation factor GreA [Parcubacteria group bacterium Greene0416_36]TSC81518.1 MAG: transcription elongation factor GreA [Parcubacteria group bacterium Gr01-1014_18]TSC99671.1 MAG: transcription elongation factor GreA [Parcubacteria group bacterium Greene1014_20]TSD07122.1 MAG: transcription elongation factor GreA [Parcubacteria group bacterium Greene0714_2]
MDQKYFVTQQRLETLKKELEDLKGPGSEDVASQLAAAIQMGDLSENAAYEDAKDKHAAINKRIADLEDIIANAVIIEATKSAMVNIGSRIKVQWADGKKEFTIVGSQEADPINGKISNESPLGRNFIGKKKGDKFSVIVPKGTVECKILEVM